MRKFFSTGGSGDSSPTTRAALRAAPPVGRDGGFLAANTMKIDRLSAFSFALSKLICAPIGSLLFGQQCWAIQWWYVIGKNKKFPCLNLYCLVVREEKTRRDKNGRMCDSICMCTMDARRYTSSVSKQKAQSGSRIWVKSTRLVGLSDCSAFAAELLYGPDGFLTYAEKGYVSDALCMWVARRNTDPELRLLCI